MSFNKNGIISSNNIYEPSTKNLVVEENIGKSFTYTPTTELNSTLHPGFRVDFSNCTPGEKVYISMKVEWSGFDTSNTNGTFGIWCQGDTYDVTTDTWTWNASNIITSAIGNLTSTVLSATSGYKIIHTVATVPNTYPNTYNKVRVGLRSDYSNGKGTITISDLEVIQEKYYTPSPESSNSGPAIKIAKDYIVANEFYEI